MWVHYSVAHKVRAANSCSRLYPIWRMLFVIDNLDAISLIFIPIFGWPTTFINGEVAWSATGSVISLKVDSQRQENTHAGIKVLIILKFLLLAIFCNRLAIDLSDRTPVSVNLAVKCLMNLWCYMWSLVPFCVLHMNSTNRYFLWSETPKVKFKATLLEFLNPLT